VPASSPFAHRVRVRFQDVDAAGIVFFGRYFDYAHAAFEEWMRAAGLPIAELLRPPPRAARPAAAPLAPGDVGLPLAHAAADFHAPARYDEELEVAVEVERLGETSVGFVFRIGAAGAGPRATVRTTHVCVDRAAFRPAAWPSEMRAAFERVSGREKP
jgi:acyl-CoA thioesterase FadM